MLATDILVDANVLMGAIAGLVGVRDSGLGVVDTACALSVTGSEWFANYRKLCRAAGIEDQIERGRVLRGLPLR